MVETELDLIKNKLKDDIVDFFKTGMVNYIYFSLF